MCDGFVVWMGEGVMFGLVDIYVVYGKGWVNVLNMFFWMYKYWVYEGGILILLIVYWLECI